MSSTKTLLTIAVLCATGACSMLNPFVDRRREAGVKDLAYLYVGESTPENPAICYNKLTSNFEQIQKMADEECVKNQTGNKAIFVDKSVFTCRVLIPNHLYFKCINEEE